VLDLVTDFATWLQSLPPSRIYLVLLLIAYLENMVPPVPGDVAIVLAGSLVGVGILDLVPTVLIGTLGGGLGFSTVFYLGRRMGPAVHDPTRLRWIPRASLGPAIRWLDRWGYLVVAVNRFLAGGRAVIGLLAGASGLRPGAVVLLSTASAFVWTCLLVSAGNWLGSEWGTVLTWLRMYGKAVSGVLAVSLLALWVRQRMLRRARPGAGGEAG
jgi:membrane protein DedA with SNARE-associated domain